MLEFDFYDVDRARLKFTIRAEFSQDEIQPGTPIEEMSKLTLRNGIIVVPMGAEAEGPRGPEGAAPPNAAGSQADPQGGSSGLRGADVLLPEEARGKRLVLEFKTAAFERGRGPGKGQFEVLLKDGKGTTDDGAEFFFEELLFSSASPISYALRSRKPVSIRSPSFGVRSPAGLDGSLTKGGRREFTLLPPVSATLDPSRPGTVFSAPAGEGKEEKAWSRASGQGQVVAATCEGPLSIVVEGHERGAGADKPSGTTISFQKDVVIYPVEGAVSIESLPQPKGNRFECQRLDVALDSSSGQTLLRKAVATWEGGRVKAHLQRDAGGDVYTVEGDRLEWTGTASPREGERGLSGEAVLHGNPSLHGKGMVFQAERAVFRLEDDRLILQDARGSLDRVLVEAKGARRARKAGGGSSPFQGLEGGPEGPDGGALEERDAAAPPRMPLTQLWDMSADEVEFVFTRPGSAAGAAAAERRFSQFIARAGGEKLVEIKSREARGSGDPGSEAGPALPFLATGKTVTYGEAEGKVTLEGGLQGERPRFAQGENWIEARRIHLFREENLVWFEDEVRARVEDAGALRRAAGPRGAGRADAAKGAAPEAVPAEAATEDVRLEIEAAFAAARFHGEGGSLRDILARGSPEAPVRVTTVSAPWCRFTGQELHWDQGRETAQLFGSRGKEQGGAPAAGAEGLARVELEGAELAAQRILFHRATWKAHLTDRVTIRCRGKVAGPQFAAVEILTGQAEVELFEGLGKSGLERKGLLKHLDRIKSLRATRSEDALLEVRGKTFAGKAEECRWDAESRELRFLGGGMQEVELLHEQIQGPIRAREIVYDESKSLLTLQGSVEGALRQGPLPRAAAGGRSPPAAAVVPPSSRPEGPDRPPAGTASDGGGNRQLGPGGPPLVWRIATNVLEIQLREAEGGDTMELVGLRARDKVDLRNEDLFVQLRGDDLTYDHPTRKLHVFSPDGRPQTLVYDGFKHVSVEGPALPTPAPAATKDEAAAEKAHKIVAQEIWLLLYENPHALSQRGDPREWLLARFDRDVIGAFYVPPATDGKPRLEGADDLWKMVADKLTLFIDPSQSVEGRDAASARRLMPWAEALGKVVFSSGSLQATADRALYEDPEARATLFGSPARLSKDNRPVFEKPQIILRRVGGGLGMEYRAGDGREPSGPGVSLPAEAR
ncbi:MAG: hypothetical protein HY721_24090 [Planctomycetes bacterium]|nr:hypothetical protein [Planctomycetota bacterium]